MSETHLQRHVARVEQWGEERGLYDTDSPLVQFGKMVEEVGELIMAIGKDDIEGIKDAIGDVRVCLIGVCKIAGMRFEDSECVIHREGDYIEVLMGCMWTLSVCICRRERINSRGFNLHLANIADRHLLALEECDNHAWEQIKDRKGKTVNGEFIKESK